MNKRAWAVAVCMALASAPVLAQERGDEPVGEPSLEAQMAARFQPPPAGWQVPRTAWGDPDLRGTWPVDYLGQTPRERPAQYGTRAFLTDEEYAASFEEAQFQLDRYDEEVELGVMSMGHWAERGHPLRQTSMVVEPANGRYPPLTALGQRLRAEERTSWNTEVFEDLDDFGIFDRCLTRGMPSSMLPGAYNAGIEVFQSPGLVAISLEMIHETRLVHIGGTPPPAAVQFDLGYSVGRWDGDTLVIETSNFRPGMSMGPAPNSGQLKVTERLTMMNPDQIRYEAWVTDPLVMEGQYKLDIPWLRHPGYGMFEYACHEGNVQVRGYIMSTSPRFAAQRNAAWATQQAEAGQ
jgi:hypothetical protein